MAKFRLVLQSESNKNQPRVIKINIAPRQVQGFVNFFNQNLKEDRPIQIYFEKIEGIEKEKSKIKGIFRFQQDS